MAAGRVTTKIYQQKVDKTRQHNDRLHDLRQQQYHDNTWEANVLADGRVGDKRMLRAVGLMARETDMHESLLRAERDRLVREQHAAQEQSLVKELERRKVQQMRDEKTRQQVRQNSMEIRELESQLKTAYTSKERATQLAEKAAAQQEEVRRDVNAARIMKEQNEKAIAAERWREVERYKENVRYQQELERQLEEQEQKKQEAYEEFLKEKLMIDEIVRKIYEEDQRAVEREMHKQKVTQEFIDEFKAAREVWKRKEKERMQEENRSLVAYAKLQTDRENTYKKRKNELAERAERMQKSLSENIGRIENERKELQQAQHDLCLEEKEAQQREKEKADIERRLRVKLDLQRAHAQHVYCKELRLQAEREEEQRFKDQVMAKLAEDDRLEQMSAQRRRLKQQEHKRAMEKLLDDRRAQFAAVRELEVLERAQEMKQEEERVHIVEEERRRLLQEHASRLLGFLPKGVIRGDQDLDTLGDTFRQAYSCRQLDPYEDRD